MGWRFRYREIGKFRYKFEVVDMKVPKEIIATKILSSLFLFVAAAVSMALTTGYKVDNQAAVFSFILAFASIPVALAGIWIKKVAFDNLIRPALIITSAGLLLCSFFSSAAVKPAPFFPLANDFAKFVECLFFALMFVIFIELAHASIRFSNMFEKTASNKDFRIGSLFKLYFSFFYAPLVVALAVAVFVLDANALLKPALPLQFAESVEFNSVYGVAMTSSLVFVPLALIITFLFGKDVFVQTRPDKAETSESIKAQKEASKSKTKPAATKPQAKGAQRQRAQKK